MNHSRNVYVSACGLLCSECPAYIATKNNDAALIEQTAKEWSVMYKADVTPEDVWCEGCMTEGGRKSSHCEKGCEIRQCAVSKGYFMCSTCNDRVGCAKLAPVGQMVPGSATLLEAFAQLRKQFEK